MSESVAPPKVGGETGDCRHLADLAVARAQKWVRESEKYPEDRAAKLLSQVLEDQAGLDFTVAFVDGVIRPEDIKVAAEELNRLSSSSVSFLPWYLRLPFKVGGAMAPLLPKMVIPITRTVFAKLVGDLVLDVSDAKLGPAIERLKQGGMRLNMNLLGEAILGDEEANKRLTDTMALLERPDVEYVSLKVSAVTGPHNPWAYDHVVDRAVKALLPLYRRANSYEPKKFINLDMEEYKDLHMTIDVFKKILETPGLEKREAGIVLQAYLPDALPAMQDLQEWAARRVANGGGRIKVRVVKGANLSMETVDSRERGWKLTTQKSKQDTDSNYMKVLDYALTKEHTRNIKIGVAGMNLFTVGFAYELAHERGVLESGGVEFEMLTGMASPQSKAVAEDTGHLLFYVPVVNPEEYDVAIAYLVRRLEENSLDQNFMSDIFDLDDANVLHKEEQRFRRALERVYDVEVGPVRQQNRLTETAEDIKSFVQKDGEWTFENTPDSDPSLPENIEWSRQIVKAIPDCQIGIKEVEEATVSDAKVLDQMLAGAAAAAEVWAARPAKERSEIIHRVGVLLSQNRAKLMEIAAAECGKALDGGDIEVSEAVDFCHYYAQQCLELEQQAGAKFQPARVTVSTPPWNFPIAIPTGSTVSALAAGSAVIFKPAKESCRTGALLAQIMWEAGVPREVLQFVQLGNRELGKNLMADERVDRVILTGSIDTAKMFRSWDNNMGLLAETSGKNAIIVTPSADLDLAVKDIINSAFSHCGQKCSASSLAILVGSVGYSERVHRQLLDGVRSLVVDYPSNPSSQTGSLCTPAEGKLLRGLTTLGPGEHWALKPKQLDESGKLWTPGIRAGVQPGSEYHLTEYFGPILGIIRCDTLEEAIEIQNATDYGLTAGLHSLDADEINLWLDRVQAGNVYVNRGITGAIVRRQPFGGWKNSAIGAGTKAGGPSYLFGLGEWEADGIPENEDVELRNRALVEAAKVARSLDSNKEFVMSSLRSSQQALDSEFAIGHDPSDLRVERNVLRYRPLPVLIRLSEGEDASQVLMLAAAGRAVGSQVSVSMPQEPDSALLQYLRVQHIDYEVESDQAFRDRLPAWAAGAGLDGRIRLIGGDVKAVNEAVNGNVNVAVWSHPVTACGRVEMIPFVREQAVAFTNHRFGNHTPLSEQVKI